MVVSGDIKVGLTDTDDAYSAVEQGEPVKIIFPDQDTSGALFIPTTVSLIDGGLNSGEGKKLVDLLLSREVEMFRILSAPEVLIISQRHIPHQEKQVFIHYLAHGKCVELTFPNRRIL